MYIYIYIYIWCAIFYCVVLKYDVVYKLLYLQINGSSVFAPENLERLGSLPSTLAEWGSWFMTWFHQLNPWKSQGGFKLEKGLNPRLKHPKGGQFLPVFGWLLSKMLFRKWYQPSWYAFIHTWPYLFCSSLADPPENFQSKPLNLLQKNKIIDLLTGRWLQYEGVTFQFGGYLTFCWPFWSGISGSNSFMASFQ